MHFKWDSDVARDIAVEMDRLEQETEDCISEIRRGTDILQQMQGGDLSQVIGKYISAAETLAKKLRSIGEAFGNTSRGIKQADELFDNLEAQINARARNMGGELQVPAYTERDTAWNGMDQGGVAPIFYNLPGTEAAPIGQVSGVTARSATWHTLAGINQTVVIDQVSLNSDMVMPKWLQSIIDEE